jgi:hypothetical protein
MVCASEFALAGDKRLLLGQTPNCQPWTAQRQKNHRWLAVVFLLHGGLPTAVAKHS